MGTPRTWVAGETVTAAFMNGDIRDQFNSLFGAWTDFSAQASLWTAATPPALGNGTLVASYLRPGGVSKMLLVRYSITMGSTTTYGVGQWLLALPSPLTAQGLSFLPGWGVQGALLAPIVAPIIHGASQATLTGYTTSGNAVFIATDATHPWTWATGNTLRCSGLLEVF